MPKPKSKQRTILMVVAAIAVVACALAIVLGSSSTTNPTTTIPHSTTTVPKESAGPLLTADNASASVTRNARYINKPSDPVSAADITKEASYDSGTLFVLKNIGDIASSPREVVFEWRFGKTAIPIVVCMNVPSSSALSATQLTCSKKLVPAKALAAPPTTTPTLKKKK